MQTQAIVLTLAEAADMVKMTRGRFAKKAKGGEIPSVDLGDGELRFDPADLKAWADSCKRPATAGSQA